MISSASVSAALAGLAALTSVARAQDCTPLLDVAGAEGRSTFVEVINSLVDNPAADDIAAAATATEPLDQPLTIFVPTNSELSAAGASLGGNVDALIYVLATHIVPGTITGDEIIDGEVTEATALNGEQLIFTDMDPDDEGDFATVRVGDGPNVVISDTDIETCAGVVHLINKVLIPGDGADAPALAPGPMVEEELEDAMTPEIAPEMADMPMAEPMVADAPVMPPMEEEDAMPPMAEAPMAADAPAPEMEDAMEEMVPVVPVEDAAPPPGVSDRGVVLPAPAGECNSVLDALALQEDTTQLAAVASQLLPPETLEFLGNPENNLTVLAPPNEVVTCLAAALDSGVVSELDVIDVLSLHVVPGYLEAADVLEADGVELETANINGATLMVMVDGEMVMFAASDESMVTVVETDIDGCGSAQIIHRIDGVLLPPTLNITVTDLNCPAAAPLGGPRGAAAPEEAGSVGVAGFLAAAAAAAFGALLL